MSERPSIWRKPLTPEQINGRTEGTVVGLLGIRVTEVGAGVLRAAMPVDARHVQPWGMLHGGVSVVLAETLGSTASFLSIGEGARTVGLEVNANHLAAVPAGGEVTAECRPVHLGRSTQVWSIEIRRADGKLACVSRLTCAILEGGAAAGD